MSDPYLKGRPLYLILGWIGVAIVIWLSLTPSPPKIDMPLFSIDKVQHFMAYLLLTGWFLQIYHRPTTRYHFGIFFIAMGAGLEVGQWLGGIRVLELGDMAANTLGAITALMITQGRSRFLLRGFERVVRLQRRDT